MSDKSVVKQTNGKVWLVGAGPSDAGLITVKGLDVLRQADVVVYDNLVGIEILNLIPWAAQKIDVGKRSNNHPVPQHEINQILLTQALAGRNVVRLKGGDSFLFGRGGEELELISRHGIAFEVVPGITSALAVPAYAGIPVTHRDFCSSLHIVTGHTKEGESPSINFEALVRLHGTIVFLMGVSSLNLITEGLLRAGMKAYTPAAIVESGTTSRQRKVISTLGGLGCAAAAAKIKAPSVIIVGDVCSLAAELSWAEKRPLHGLRTVVTRPEGLCSELSKRIRQYGAEAVELPCIKTVPLEDMSVLEQALGSLDRYDWLIFTSAAGVEAVFEKLWSSGKDMRELYGKKIAVIGSATAEAVHRRGLRTDFMPSSYNVRTLARELPAVAGNDTRMLVLRAKEGSQDLNDGFDEAGIHYLDVPVYETVYNTDGLEFSRAIVENGEFDYALFTSASTVKGFVKALPGLEFTAIKALCIGEQTAAEARKHGMQVIISPVATIDSMVQTLISVNRSQND